MRKWVSKLVPEKYKPLTVFPYPFVGEPRLITSGMGMNGLAYAECDWRRIYFPTDCTPERAEQWYRCYLEDEGLTGDGRRTKSPHCYVTPVHQPKAGDVIVDLGCAEGFFSARYADIAKRLYLIEADAKWRMPIMATFEKYSDKTSYIGKFVGNESNDSCIRLSDALAETGAEDTFFIKMDIEGGERDVIESSAEFLKCHRVKMSCCAYHRPDDARVLSKLLKDLGFSIEFSEGWMLPYDSRTFPFFRRGMIYASNFFK